MVDFVKVSQAAREAAASVIECGYPEIRDLTEQYHDGSMDGTNLTQAFARFENILKKESNEVEQAWNDVRSERERQIVEEGHTREHDDINHDCDNALSRAAACYALAGVGNSGPFWINRLQVPQQVWPYRWEWKPSDRRRNLIKAAALLLAEIERIDRQENDDERTE